MGLLGLFVTAFLVGLSGAMAPGSLLVVTISESVRRGFSAGPLISLGHALLELIMVVFLAAGLGQVLAHHQVLGLVGISGGVMLLWFAYATWKSAGQAQLALSLDADPKGCDPAPSSRLPSGRWATVGAGVAASLSNPYWILWWATIGAAYVATAAGYGATGVGVFYTGHIASDFLWYSLVAWAIATGKRFINDRAYRLALYTCSLFLVALAIYFLQLGIRLAIKG